MNVNTSLLDRRHVVGLKFQTKKTATWLCETLIKDGHAVALLIGDLTVEQRITILDRFRDGKHRVLITTNVLARGMCRVIVSVFH